MTIKNAKLWFVCTAAGMILPFAACAALVVDGGFEQQITTPDSCQTFNSLSTMGWRTVSAGSVDLIRNYWQPAGGSQSVDMVGFFQNGTIEQTIVGTTIGSMYHLTFDMSGNPDGAPLPFKTVRVTFGNTTTDFTFDTTGINHSHMGWQLRSGDFLANSSGVLSFTDISGGVGSGTAFGAVIDNVSLAAVPEPTTMIAGALLLLPFGASALKILRKNRTA